MYGVNAGVPKTLVRHLVRHAADCLGGEVRATLLDIRSCLPDGPKVGSVSLSPRTDWRMPSDAAAALWIRECERL